MAYITTANFIRLIKGNKSTETPTKEYFLKNIYNSLEAFEMLDFLQKQKLATTVEILNNKGKDLEKRLVAFNHLNFLDSKRPNKLVIFKEKGGQPSYHTNENCDALHNDYFNITLPEELDELDKLYPELNAIDFARELIKKELLEIIMDNLKYKKEVVLKEIDTLEHEIEEVLKKDIDLCENLRKNDKILKKLVLKYFDEEELRDKFPSVSEIIDKLKDKKKDILNEKEKILKDILLCDNLRKNDEIDDKILKKLALKYLNLNDTEKNRLVNKYNYRIVPKFDKYTNEEGSIIKEISVQYSLAKIHLKNKGIATIITTEELEELEDLEEILKKRKELLNEYKDLADKLKVISKYSFCYNKNDTYIKERIKSGSWEHNNYIEIEQKIGKEKIIIFWEKHYLLSKKIFYFIMNFLLTEKYNVENIVFSPEALEKYNFKKCFFCQERELKEIANYSEVDEMIREKSQQEKCPVVCNFITKNGEVLPYFKNKFTDSNGEIQEYYKLRVYQSVIDKETLKETELYSFITVYDKGFAEHTKTGFELPYHKIVRYISHSPFFPNNSFEFFDGKKVYYNNIVTKIEEEGGEGVHFVHVTPEERPELFFNRPKNL